MNSDTVILLINKMLEKHNVDIEYVKANPVINGQDWYAYFTWTEQEEQEYRKWAISTIAKKTKCGKKLAEREFSWFNLMYGLKVI